MVDLSEPQIIFQDDSILVIDKTAGWVTNRAESVHGSTIQDWVEQNHFLDIANRDSSFDQADLDVFLSRSGVVHRLDKDTSGLLIIAKTPQAFVNLQQQFQDRIVKKTYLALVHGRVESKEGTISVPVGRQVFNRKKFGIIPDGRPSVTGYEVVDNFITDPNQSSIFASSTTKPSSLIKATGIYPHKTDVESFTLLKLSPQTGRTHQIRVHLKYINHPIVSDPLYLGHKTLKKDLHWCPRLFLHAHQLNFLHPRTHTQLHFTSPLPKDLSQLVF